MRTEALDRVRLVFGLFDADGNGVLEPEDFALMSDRVTDAAPDAPKETREAVTASFRQWWETLAAELDTNGDGRVDFEEFTGFVLAPERFERALGDFATALSRVGDPDGDGLVEHADFHALMAAIGFAPGNTQALLDALTSDGGAHVPVAAWDDAIREFYRPDAADTPGNHLVTG